MFHINSEHTGDVLRCDEKDDDCTSVLIVLEETITGDISTAAVYCNFKDVSSRLSFA